MVRETKVTYAPCASLLHQEVERPVVQVPAVQIVHAPLAHAVKQVIVYIVHLQFLH